ncbi:MAG: tRNA pseudouridine(55) synthase TruB [Chloroflexi bacterium]|nr:MAG: tRNA pseudouridine(55) synthase TruB [Phototrophicales bacterium]RMF78144.1 MAG: tRNA pseudouridine(55) synthase TruB [Chloroflexota bacterium]
MTITRPFGFLNIDKPRGMTSHDVVARIRRGLRIKKVGHAGTLDPMATGVLVICLGPATRLSEYVMPGTKQYRATMRLGVTTTTYDAEGEVLQERDVSHITQDDIEHALAQFRGDIAQVPPMYSAVKRGGRKLYELARAGEVVERPPRPVTIHALEIVQCDLPDVVLDVTCSAGTYIRSLAHDVGETLNVGAHLTALTRTASGAFLLDDALELDALFDHPDWQQCLLAPEVALADMPAVQLDDVDVNDIQHGRAIVADAPTDSDMIARAHAPDGRLVAIVKPGHGKWHPLKVFLT